MVSLQLQTTINDELRWREAELAIAKLHLHRFLLEKSSFAYSYRCFIVLTYAHYEAFTKRVVAQSMRDIFDSGIKWSECQSGIRKNLFSAGLRKLVATQSNDDLATAASRKLPLIDDVPPPPLSIIMECGNLNYTTFLWALECIGLDTSGYGFARPDVGRLVAMRHDCAHGEALTFDPTKTERALASEIFGLQQRILVLLHHLSVHILDHFAFDGYRAH